MDGALLHSVEEKARASRLTGEMFFRDQAPALVATARTLTAVYRGGGRLFSMGNGGSSCDATHVAVEFAHPVTTGRPALAAVSLVCDLALITAVGNDVGFEHVFVRQLDAQARAGDALLGFSTSGDSANLVAAFAKARDMGLATLGMAGGDGGRMKSQRSCRPSADRADELDPSHPGMPRHRLSHPVGPWFHTLLADHRGSAARTGAG